MTESSIRNTKIGCGVFMLLIFGSFYTYFHFAQRSQIEAMEGAREDGRHSPAVKDTPRLTELRQLEHRDPERALAVADLILAQPKSDAERRAALSRLPALLQNASVRRLKGGQRAEALALRERLERDFPASEQAGWLRNEWRSTLARAAVDSLRAGDPAAIEAAYGDLWAAEPRDAERFAFEQWSSHLLKRWGDAQAAGRGDANAIRLAISGVISETQGLERAAQEFSRDALPAGPIAQLGDAQVQSQRPHAALALWRSASYRLESGRGEWEAGISLDAKRRDALQLQLRQKLATGWTDLGDRLRRGDRPRFVLISARDAYEAAAKAAHGLGEEMEALTKLLDFESGDVAALATPVTQVRFVQLNGSGQLATEVSHTIVSRSYEVRARINQVVGRHGLRLWQCRLDTPGFDPWGKVPVRVREGIDSAPGIAAAPAPLPEAERRRKLAEHYRGDALHIPLGELDPLRAALHQVFARWGLVNLSGNAEDAFTMLREVLRESTDARLREELAQTLRFRITRSGKTGDFNQFYLLAGFYAGEIGLPAAGDPFRAEFRSGLVAAAENFRKGERMKRIFILSLLAQCFPDEAAGRQARTDAFAAAFEAVASLSAEQTSAPILPSPLAGHSVELINNGTDHHLLSFYRGPEMIAVHNWPWRRGTVVVPDGDYELAVLSPAATIRPDRGEATFKRGVRVSEYVIKNTSGKNDAARTALSSLASGDYKLLYAPAAMGALAVEPRTGLPVAKRAP